MLKVIMCHAWKSKLALSLFVTLGGFLLTMGTWNARVSAATGVNSQLSFEGKLVNSSGSTNIADGTYNLEFKIYQDGTNQGAGNTLKWTEDFLVGGTNGGVTITNGTFQVNLGGSTAPFTSVDWNQDTLWLAMQVGNTTSCTISTTFTTNCGGDGEMKPYIRLTSTPYSLNSDKLDGLDSTAFGQLATANTWTAANKIQTASTTAFQIQNASSNGLVVNVDTTANATHLQVLDGAATQTALDLSPATITASGALAINSSGVNSITLDSTGTGGVNIGGTNSNAKAITIGNQTSGTTISLKSGGNISLSPVSSGDVVYNEGTGSNMQITATAVPTVDQVAISNTGQGITTAGVNGLSINYVGGAAAVESAGERIDLTPGTSSGGTWNGLRIVANATGTVSGVSETGLKLEGPTSPGSGTETAVKITTGWDIGLDVQSGGIQLADISTPTTPANGSLRVYSTSVAGRSMLAGVSSSGVDYAYQPSLFQQNVVLITPGNNTTASTFTGTGGLLATSGTLSSASVTEAQGSMGNVISSTTAGSGAGVSTATSQYYRGSGGNNADGFFFFARVNLPDSITSYTSSTTGSRIFIGLSSPSIIGSSSMTSSDNPTGDYAGFMYSGARDTSPADFKFITKNNTTQHVTDTGVALAVAKTYDFYVYCKPSDSTIYWRIDNLTDGTAPVEGAETNDLPTITTPMKAGLALAPLSTTAHNIRMQRIYVESDR